MSPPSIAAGAPPYPRRWKALGVLSLSLLVISLDNTILNVALPTIRTDLDATSSQLQWIVDAYLLVFAGLLLSAGSLGDRFGRRRTLFTGLTIFGLGSLCAALSSGSTELIASRAVMGIGAAAIMPTTLSILTNTFTGISQVDRVSVDAARGMGMTESEIVRKVELPLAVPTIMGGVRTATINIVATATIAPLAGVLTLGDFIINPNVYGNDGVLAGAILVALLALSLELLLAGVQYMLTSPGLRERRA